jgi:hypothetical protein
LAGILLAVVCLKFGAYSQENIVRFIIFLIIRPWFADKYPLASAASRLYGLALPNVSKLQNSVMLLHGVSFPWDDCLSYQFEDRYCFDGDLADTDCDPLGLSPSLLFRHGKVFHMCERSVCPVEIQTAPLPFPPESWLSFLGDMRRDAGATIKVWLGWRIRFRSIQIDSDSLHGPFLGVGAL